MSSQDAKYDILQHKQQIGNTRLITVGFPCFIFDLDVNQHFYDTFKKLYAL